MGWNIEANSKITHSTGGIRLQVLKLQAPRCLPQKCIVTPMVDLAGWRKRKGISLPAIAAATKIGMRYLQAIETSNFRDLPGGVYSISYIRQYARAIGYDPDILVEFFCSRTKPAELPPAVAQNRGTWISRVWNRIRLLFNTSWHGRISDLRE